MHARLESSVEKGKRGLDFCIYAHTEMKKTACEMCHLPKFRQNAYIPSLPGGTFDTQFLHLRLQRRAFEPQNFSGTTSACKPPAAFFQDA